MKIFGGLFCCISDRFKKIFRYLEYLEWEETKVMKIILMVCSAAFLQSKHFALMDFCLLQWWSTLLRSYLVQIVFLQPFSGEIWILAFSPIFALLAPMCLCRSVVSGAACLGEILGGHQQCLKITDERFLWCVSGNFRWVWTYFGCHLHFTENSGEIEKIGGRLMRGVSVRGSIFVHYRGQE